MPIYHVLGSNHRAGGGNRSGEIYHVGACGEIDSEGICGSDDNSLEEDEVV